ncbi:O-antigen ligase family protein [Crenalkalicoccus roseus]|uniref:O-antigen ligase family protein n=1 Tax=Crenalkalicoccus roseus TaxID=1485588 RepID=UPI0010814AE5|nr:O-antigen ligase family protein [Crenalkalicoccus roseus]
MRVVASPAFGLLASFLGASALLLVALLLPERTMMVLPLLVLALLALVLYQIPVAFAALLVLMYGLGLDIQFGVQLRDMGGSAAALGVAVVKIAPFALAASLILRYGVSRAINWPFLAFTVVGGLSLAILPISNVIDTGEMVRSFLGSTAPFALGFALAPHKVWTVLVRGVAAVPVTSALLGLFADLLGLYPAFDRFGRFQGLHSPPFLAGFCVTAIFACVLEYLRGFRPIWLVAGGMNLAVLLATQARAPLFTVALFLLTVFLLSNRRIFPLQRKVDLVMGGLVPAALLLGPFVAYALERFIGRDGEFNYSGRDIIWPYFTEAIAARPLFGWGLGAGKLIVDPEDPMIRLLGSNAAHNEYLRLAVDAGIVGCALIFLCIIAWIWGGTRRAAPSDRLVLRAALVAALVHSGFDNTLIATTAVMQFTFFAAAMARARIEARLAQRQHPAWQGAGRYPPATHGGYATG